MAGKDGVCGFVAIGYNSGDKPLEGLHVVIAARFGERDDSCAIFT
jgi:hypothetical protein